LCRAYVTTKAEAFTTPSALYFGKPNFRDGINGLTLDVELLIEAYDRLGRPDLAECVRRGRKYQRMNEVLGGRPDLAQLNGLSEAFLGDKAGEPSKTLDAWKERAMERYGGDEGSKRVMRLSLG